MVSADILREYLPSSSPRKKVLHAPAANRQFFTYVLPWNNKSQSEYLSKSTQAVGSGLHMTQESPHLSCNADRRNLRYTDAYHSEQIQTGGKVAQRVYLDYGPNGEIL